MPDFVKGPLRRFIRDERGDAPQVLLIIALIVVPLIILLIYFKDKVITFFTDVINNLFGEDDGSVKPEQFD